MKKDAFKPLAKSLQELFSKKNRWCQNSYAKNKNNKDVESRSTNAVKFCLLGGLKHVYGDKLYNVMKQKLHASLPLPNKTPSIAYFNDRPRTKLADIRKLVKKAGV